MLRSVPSNRLVADSRDADDLPIVVDRGRGARGVAGDQRKLLDLIRNGAPDDCLELENLRRHARRVMNRVFRPADRLASIIRTRGKAVRPAERRQRSHRTAFPRETETNESGRGGRWEKGGATPVLSIRIRRRRLTDAGESADTVFHGPNHAAVQAAKRPE